MFFTKRMLLASVAAVFTSCVNAQILQFSGAPLYSFQGNPNVTITGITGSIVASRTGGQTPCFVQTSASGISATGTSVPYEDLSYYWDFGDSSGTETFTQPLNNNLNIYAPTSVNANNAQSGPEAAYCYRSAGTYTVTLIAIGNNASSGKLIRRFTATVTVTAFTPSTTWYYDQNASGANNGTSPTNAFTDITTLKAKIQGASSPTSILFANGSHWSGAYAFDSMVATTTINGLRLANYVPASGSTAIPIIEATSGSPNALLYFYNGGASSTATMADVVIRNLSLIGSGTFSGALISIAPVGSQLAAFSNFYFDNLAVTTNVSSPTGLNQSSIQYNSQTATGNFDNAGWWGGSINSLAGDGAYGTGFFGGTANWFFMVGLSNINGAGSATSTPSQLNHHIYASVHNHALFRYINCGSSAVSGTNTRNLAIKIDYYPSPQRTITGTSSGTGGVVRLAVSDTTGFTTGNLIYVELVGGTTEANGQWVGTVIDSTHIDLAGTVFVHAWTSGGDCCPYAAGQYWLIDGCNITGTSRSYDASNNFNSTNQSSVTNYVVQNCAIHNLSLNSMALIAIAISFTMRYCNWWSNDSYALFAPSQGATNNSNGVFRIYKNRFYVPATASSTIDANNGAIIFNYLKTLSNPQTLTDNVIQDMRTNADALSISFSGLAGSTINRNQYYAPNAAGGNFLFNGASITTFSALQSAGFDTAGLVSNPNWANPAIGNFS